MKLEMTLAVLLCSALGACCTTPKPDGPGFGTAPGGDCVININPALGGFGASFGMGHQFNGNEGTNGPDTIHTIKITSSEYDIKIGTIGGTWATLTKGEVYDIVIKNLQGPKAHVVNSDDDDENYPISVDPHGNKYKADGFAVIARDNKVGSDEYVSVIITKDGTGVRFEVIK